LSAAFAELTLAHNRFLCPGQRSMVKRFAKIKAW
jgi:hypothetical protein